MSRRAAKPPCRPPRAAPGHRHAPPTAPRRVPAALEIDGGRHLGDPVSDAVDVSCRQSCGPTWPPPCTRPDRQPSAVAPPSGRKNLSSPAAPSSDISIAMIRADSRAATALRSNMAVS